MKVVNIIHRYAPAIGGAERWCQENAQYMAQKGLCVHVLTTDLYDIEDFFRKPDFQHVSFKLGKREYDGNILVKRYGINRFPHWIHKKFTSSQWSATSLGLFLHSPHSWKMYAKMFAEIREADLVHLHTLPYFHNFIGICLAKVLKKKVILTPHFHPGHVHYERKSIYWLLRQCDGILTVSKSEKAYLAKKGIDDEKLFDSGNWVDPERYQTNNFQEFKEELFAKYDIGENDRTILFIGKKYLKKGFDTLIEAVIDLNKELPFKIFIFMIGPDTDEFFEYCNDLSDEDRRCFINFGVVSHQQKVNLLHLCDVLVLPSEFEAFGIVFLEAWVCGKPVITCPFMASGEIVGDAGLLFEFGDRDELKKKIMAVLSDRSLARRLGENGKKKVYQDYLFSKVGEKIFRSYTAVRGHKRKVLFVSHLFPPYFLGGSELVAYQQAMAIKERGHTVEVFCGKLNPQGRGYKVTEEKGPFPVTRINLFQHDFDHRLNANYNKEEIQNAFKQVLNRFAPDIVHFHNIYALSAKMIDVCYDLHIPMVMTLHDYWPICHKNIALKEDGEFCQADHPECLDCKGRLQDGRRRMLSLAERNRLFKESFEKLDGCISPSRYLADLFANSWMAAKKVKVIHNGINLKRFARVKKKKNNKIKYPIRFTFIGYLSHHKGVENLLLAFSLLKNKEKARLTLVGQRSTFDYPALACQIGLKKHVLFRKPIPNKKVNQLYQKTDVLILPSVWPENCPVSITEAMACGIPVIASNAGGIKELVEDGVTGLLFHYSDPEALAERMEEFINHPEKIQEMGARGYTKIQECGLENQVDLILKEYDRVIYEHA